MDEMHAESLLILIFGMLAGGCLGYLATWRFARKLEAHEVVLADWDKPFDQQAPAAAKVLSAEGRF